MSAVLESVSSPVEAAKSALESAQAELAALDARISGYQHEQEEIDLQKQAHRVATITAVSAGAPVPKPLKVKQTDAAVALPILRAKRQEFVERVADAEGKLRRACVQDVERRLQATEHTFADAARQLIDAWREVIGMSALLEQAGVTTHPLPPALMSAEFSIPVIGPLRPICENHAMAFIASHALDQGEGSRATWGARRQIESEIGMTLPW
jgi:hypothetical protein